MVTVEKIAQSWIIIRYLSKNSIYFQLFRETNLNECFESRTEMKIVNMRLNLFFKFRS
jgi:hypothetical protein